MNILITGANGFIGSHLTYALLEHGHQVTAGVHNVLKFKRQNPSLKIVDCDFNADTTPEHWLEKLHNIDIVINAVGIFNQSKSQPFKNIHQVTPMALFKACEIVGVKKVINISALGSDMGEDDNTVSEFHRSKKIADDFLMTLKLNWVIAMPSIVYGAGAKSMGLFTTIAALPITPLVAKGEQEIQPIHINDLCKAILQIVISENITHVKIAFVGPKSITMKNIFTQLKQWLGMSSCRFLSIPYSLALFISHFMKLIPNSAITPESLAMLKHGNCADVTEFKQHFNFMPVSFSTSLQRTPALKSDRWHAKLTLLQPLLKLSIAFVWIFTGVVSMFIYPVESSYLLLKQIGLSQQYLPTILFSAAIMDVLLGMAILFSVRLKLIGIIQIFIILTYTLLITLFIPEQWAHPFGPISKNIPLIAATLIMVILHDRAWK